jgi:hypothetical protein
MVPMADGLGQRSLYARGIVCIRCECVIALPADRPAGSVRCSACGAVYKWHRFDDGLVLQLLKAPPPGSRSPGSGGETAPPG